MAEVIAVAGIFVPAAATLAAPIVQHLTEKSKSKAGNSISLDDLHEVLNSGLKKLLALQSDIGIKQKDPSEVYKIWMDSVSKIEKEVASLNTKYGQVRGKKWHFGTNNRGSLKVQMKSAVSDVIKLVEECPEKTLVDKLPERVIKEVGVPPIDENLYPTLYKAFQDILALVQSEGVKCVALCGQKGVGKTTLMQHLNNHFYGSVDFDMVIFVKVAADEQTKDLHILQKIADRIKVDSQVNDFDEVAGRIQKVLENKRYLLILDGMRHGPDRIWKKLDISKEEKDSKVVITTHYPLAVKSSCVNRKVELKPLSNTEALRMFRDIVGTHLPQDKADLICKRFCSCLPLLIDPIARSFIYQEAPTDWQKALKEWMPWPQVGVEGLEELYSKLEICYKRLCDPSKQKCFLYASLYPANNNIYTHCFVECCIAQGFFDAVGATTKYSEMRNRAIDVILRHLVNVAFLEEVEQMKYVKMNDFYRQFALHLSSKDPDLECIIYVDNEEHEEALSRPRKHVKWVSLVGNERDSLPTIQNCEILQTLLLQKNLKLIELPENYFHTMSNLLVLNMYGTKITSLPSLEGLSGLKAFYLNGCSDLTVSPEEIQPLQHLEVFDIRGNRVNFVPYLEHTRQNQVQYLKHLRCLKSSYTACGDYHHIISMLHSLEELIIEVEKQFQPQWDNAAKDNIQQIAVQRKISFRWYFK